MWRGSDASPHGCIVTSGELAAKGLEGAEGGGPFLRGNGLGTVTWTATFLPTPLDADRKRVFHSGMKKILFWTGVCVLTIAAGTVRGQDAGTQQQLDKLSGQIQDLTEAQQAEGKRMEAIEKELADLAAKVNTPQVNDSASTGDLKKLAEDVQELDKKRLADRELILAQIQKLGQISAAGGEAPVHHSHAKPVNDTPADTGGPAVPTTGYEYVVKDGDTLGGIAKKYKSQGVKVTTTQILKANPGLNPNALYVGKKIFIPDPNAK